MKLLFLLHLRHCYGASSPPSLAADVTQWAAEEDAGGEGEDGDGVSMEYCPDSDRRDAHSTAVTALAAALMFPGPHSHAYDLQKHLWKVKFSCIQGLQLIFQEFLQPDFSTKTKTRL